MGGTWAASVGPIMARLGELCWCECHLRAALTAIPDCFLGPSVSATLGEMPETAYSILGGCLAIHTVISPYESNSLSCREIEWVQSHPNGWYRVSPTVGQPLFLVTMMRKCFHLNRKMLEWFSCPLPLLLASKRPVGALSLSQAKGGNSLRSLLLKCWQDITEQF